MFSVVLKKWGNSQGVIFPKSVLDMLNLKIGDGLSVKVEEGKIVMEALTVTRGKYKLEELLERIPEDYKAEEVSWGEPQGKEYW